MQKMLEFLDRLCLEERMFWSLPRHDGGELEVRWDRHERPEAWQVRLSPGAPWERLEIRGQAALLAQELERRGCDSEVLQRQLGASLLTQAVLADMVLNGAKDLFGEAVVSRSIDDTRAFLGAIGDAAAKLSQTPPNSSRGLRLV